MSEFYDAVRKVWMTYVGDHWETEAEVRRTQLSYLDLAAFYLAAKDERDWAVRTLHEDSHWRQPIIDVCDKLIGVINALRQDGLDPHWNPERDALTGIETDTGMATVFCADGMESGKYMNRIDDVCAKEILFSLHQRGYKIVKVDQ